MNSVAPRISDWMWPSPSPSMKNQANRTQSTTPKRATNAAAATNTRSGSYSA